MIMAADKQNWLMSVLLLISLFMVFPVGSTSDLHVEGSGATNGLPSDASLLQAANGKRSHLSGLQPVRDKEILKGNNKIGYTLKSVLSDIDARGITRKNARLKKASNLSNMMVRVDADARIQVYIHAALLGPAELKKLLEHEVQIEVSDEDLAIVQGWVPHDRLEEIAILPFVKRITQPSYGAPRSGSVTTEGDAILKADLARQLGFDGSGVKVGVISDGANDWTSARATGDLPESISIYGSCTRSSFNGSICSRGKTCNEGTAMLEIIHDIAPGAQLAIASGGTSLEFIQRVNELVNNFGADIIVDDVWFPLEPYFADGPIAQKVASVLGQTVFVSSAGNSAQGHYEANFASFDALGPDFHNFGLVAGVSDNVTMNVVINPGRFMGVLLQWNDRFEGSANNYDLGLVNEAVTQPLCPTCVSAVPQSGSQDPLEGLCYFNQTSNPVPGKIIIERVAGADKRLEMFMLGGEIEEYNMPGGSVSGHSAVPGVLAVGAIAASNPDTIEPFSSHGPARIDFPSVQIRQKPDLSAIDGVSVTGTGGFPATFYGTSASAPHIAGIAALVQQAYPSLTPSEVGTLIRQTAVDLGGPGFDAVFGHGRANAKAAVEYALVLNPDDDNDGILDSSDDCPLGERGWSSSDSTDYDGDGCRDIIEDSDDDNDGVLDEIDAFPLDASESSDNDNDGTGDNADTDDDNDGVSDEDEIAAGRNPLVNESAVVSLILALMDEALDTDNDGIPDAEDNCPEAVNPNQLDTDQDKTGNACDSDDDNDTLLDIDEDKDKDGILDPEETDPLNADTDSDGLRDDAEIAIGTDPRNPDTDNDGINDGDEVATSRNPSVNEGAIITILQQMMEE